MLAARANGDKDTMMIDRRRRWKTQILVFWYQGRL